MSLNESEEVSKQEASNFQIMEDDAAKETKSFQSEKKLLKDDREFTVLMDKFLLAKALGLNNKTKDILGKMVERYKDSAEILDEQKYTAILEELIDFDSVASRLDFGQMVGEKDGETPGFPGIKLGDFAIFLDHKFGERIYMRSVNTVYNDEYIWEIPGTEFAILLAKDVVSIHKLSQNELSHLAHYHEMNSKNDNLLEG